MASVLTCPRCGNGEVHPRHKHLALIRGRKVCDDAGNWWSQCLVCAGYYYPNSLVLVPKSVQVHYANAGKGWFKSA